MAPRIGRLGRREFATGLAAVGIVGLRSDPAQAEPPPETTRLRVLRTPSICEAPAQVASGLLAQTFDGLEEVERFLSRVTSRQIARFDELSKGTRYEAAIRLRLDINQLPKPFQLSALGSREWSLQSDWYHWGFTP